MTYKTYTYRVRVYDNGYKSWFLKVKGLPLWRRHREDGPAVEYANGNKHWFLNGKRHREDGPAVEDADGYKAWFLNGIKYTEAEWKAKLSPVKELSVKEISDLLGYEVKVVK